MFSIFRAAAETVDEQIVLISLDAALDTSTRFMTCTSPTVASTGASGVGQPGGQARIQQAGENKANRRFVPRPLQNKSVRGLGVAFR